MLRGEVYKTNKASVSLSDAEASSENSLPTLPLLRSTIGVTGLTSLFGMGRGGNPGAVVT